MSTSSADLRGSGLGLTYDVHAVPQLLQPSILAALGRLRDEGESFFGARVTDLLLLRTIARRASVLIHVEIVTRAARYRAYVKLYRSEPERAEDMRRRVQADFAMNRRVYDALLPVAGLGAVRPIACFPEYLVLVTEEAAGPTLTSVLERQARWSPSEGTMAQLSVIARHLATWLRAFQATAPSHASFSLSGMREYNDVRLRVLTNSGAFSSRERARVLEFFDSTCAEVAPDELLEVPIHADYCLGNVIVNGSDVIVLDFAMSKLGSVFHDVSHMATQFQMMGAKPWFRRSTLNALVENLLDGFAPGLTRQRPLYRLFEAQHVLCQLAKMYQRPASGVVRRTYSRYMDSYHRRWLRSLGAL